MPMQLREPVGTSVDPVFSSASEDVVAGIPALLIFSSVVNTYSFNSVYQYEVHNIDHDNA